MKILGFNIGGKTQEQPQNILSERGGNKSVVNAILEQQKYRYREDLKTFEDAIEARDNIVNYDREELHRIYRKCMQDAHVSSQWMNRKLHTLKKEFYVCRDGQDEPDDELTNLLRQTWFYKFLDAAMDSIAWGFTLIEFGVWTGETFVPYRMKQSKKIHPDVLVVERDNVKPEYGILVYTPGNSTGIDLTDPKYKNCLAFIGNSENGWLYEAAKPYLIKDNTLKNWSEFSELFGMDVRVFKTEAEGDNLKRAKQGLKNAVGGGSMIMGLEDSLEYIGTGRSDAYNVFKQLVDSQNSALSKLIHGQDVVSNNTGQVVGTTGENIADMYSEADARLMKFYIESVLFPLLSANGVNIEGAKFKWSSKENLSLEERVDIDLKISQMGFKHSSDYINETYDTNVEESPEESQQRIENQLKEIYGNG
jgi:hypothetical protein